MKRYYYSWCNVEKNSNPFYKKVCFEMVLRNKVNDESRCINYFMSEELDGRTIFESINWARIEIDSDQNDDDDILHYNNFLTLFKNYQELLIEERDQKITELLTND